MGGGRVYYPDKKEFVRLARKANVVPVYREILADLLTPVSAFLKVKNDFSYLLESVEGEEKIARFSFIGIKPSIIFKSKDNLIELVRNGKKRTFRTDSPLKEIARIMDGFKPAHVKGLPRFSGGLVGYMGYDMVRFFEELPDENPDDLKVADAI
ncbi:MAG: anthranilate synthase component I, partial [Candidatus Omnitrophica bacterium]|nr:anthranilate synthase component I [Candidatus Omnitrophota bacterium]